MTERQFHIANRILAFMLTGVLLFNLPGVPRRELAERFDWLMYIDLEEILIMREKPKPKPLPIPVSTAKVAPRATPSPVVAPTQVASKPSQIVVEEPTLQKPEFGMVHELFDTPPEERPQTKLSPNASPLPDIITQRADAGESRPQAAFPAPAEQSGRVFKGTGAPDLAPALTPSYTGPNLNLPEAEQPAVGLSRGEELATSPTPGVARGEMDYQSSVGRQAGPGTSEAISLGTDLIGEGELSGLLDWLRANPGTFSPVLMAYMETNSSDLKGVTTYGGWDIFIQYSQAEGQLKIFLSRADQGILLADSDFKRRSQLFGLGSVSRTGRDVTAITARRDRPTAQLTDNFYSVFQGWMSSKGIQLAGR
ncbi:MAG: hypothetical protein H6505_03140 [Calditrichaeota bacterium]|nr:hypothetical protein [Calditrichota bacterium]